METPLVSITCITYNHGKYLAQAIEGFLMQQASFPFEIIIGEDCSTDNTLQVATEYSQRYPDLIQVVTGDKNVGPRENGIRIRKRAKGKYIAICEGDDYWTDPYKLQKQVDFLEQNTEYHLIGTNAKKLKDGAFSPCLDLKSDLRIEKFKLIKSATMPTCTIMFRASLLEQLHSMNLELSKVGYMDMIIRSLANSLGPLYIINDCTAVYRVHEGGIFQGTDPAIRFSRVLENFRLTKPIFVNGGLHHYYYGLSKYHKALYKFSNKKKNKFYHLASACSFYAMSYVFKR